VWVSSFRWRLATRSARRCFSAHFGHCALCEFFGGVGGMRESRHQAQRRRLYVIELSATGEQKALAICVRCLPPLRGASSDCTAGCCCVCKHEKANQGRFRLHGAECCHVRGCTQTHTNTHTQEVFASEIDPHAMLFGSAQPGKPGGRGVQTVACFLSWELWQAIVRNEQRVVLTGRISCL
jgi:hypothetical protein